MVRLTSPLLSVEPLDAAKALARAAETTGHTIVTTADPSDMQEAERAVLPGVGAFADCMRGLPALPGWSDLAVGGQRLSVMPSSTGCSHY